MIFVTEITWAQVYLSDFESMRKIRVSRMWFPVLLDIVSLRWRHNGHDGVSNHQPHHCLLNRLFGCRSNKTSKLHVTGLCAGKSPGAGEFPTQMASNAENISIWWRHHVIGFHNQLYSMPRVLYVNILTQSCTHYIHIIDCWNPYWSTKTHLDGRTATSQSLVSLGIPCEIAPCFSSTLHPHPIPFSSHPPPPPTHTHTLVWQWAWSGKRVK